MSTGPSGACYHLQSCVDVALGPERPMYTMDHLVRSKFKRDRSLLLCLEHPVVDHWTVRCDHRTVWCMKFAPDLESSTRGFFFSPNRPVCTTGPSGAYKNPVSGTAMSHFMIFINDVLGLLLCSSSPPLRCLYPKSISSTLELKQIYLHKY